jgi:cystathionine gamma-synthase
MKDHFATAVVHAGREVTPSTGDVVPPIHLSTTYARDADGKLLGDLYSRLDNENRRQLETCLSTLEGGQDSAALSSGSAAAWILTQSLPPGSRVVCGADMYYGVRRILQALHDQGQIQLVTTDLTKPDARQEALRPAPKLVLCETPTNPLLQVVDLTALCQEAHDAGAEVAVDNTFATPALQSPIQSGADYVIHSTTKYLGGHSDVVGGALVTAHSDTEIWERVRFWQRTGGAVLSPLDSWLTLRGICTLHVRIQAQCDNAEALAPWLESRPQVDAVHYPGLPSHPGQGIAQRQMRRPGAMLSFQLRDEPAARRMLGSLRRVLQATSLGGVHTLAEHRRDVEPPESPTPPGLVRLSAGIEDLSDLQADLAQALDAV